MTVGPPLRCFGSPLSCFASPLSSFDPPLSSFDPPLSSFDPAVGNTAAVKPSSDMIMRYSATQSSGSYNNISIKPCTINDLCNLYNLAKPAIYCV